MKPVALVREDDWGDCLRACIASILELNRDAVPDFVKDHGARWFRELVRWGEKRKTHVICVNTESLITNVHPNNLFWIALGDCVRGHRHSVICQSNVVVWDPHPSKAGLLELEDALIIFPQ